MTKQAHPTRERLIDTTVDLLGDDPAKVQVDEVLTISGVSRGSLYHHFADFSDLVEAAMVRRFSSTVDRSIHDINLILTESVDAHDLRERVRQFSSATQSPSLAPVRFERLRALGMAGQNERFRERLGTEQERLTEALAELVRLAQTRGWVDPDIDPRATAVLIQAYTLGRAVDDITPSPMDPEAWNSLIDTVVDRVLFSAEVSALATDTGISGNAK